jgi:PEP-CTERM motif
MNFRHLSVMIAALLFCAAAPLRANSIHGTKSASNQGTITDANFGTLNGGPAISGIPTTLFINNNVDPSVTVDVFSLPGFSTGAIFTLNFNTSTANYGIFTCDQGSSSTPLSATGQTLSGPCTVGDSSVASFVNFVDGATSATVQFNGGAGAPSTFVFYAIDGTLASITSGGTTTPVPEPSTIALLAVGLVGLLLFRRRSTAQATAAA